MMVFPPDSHFATYDLRKTVMETQLEVQFGVDTIHCEVLLCLYYRYRYIMANNVE